MIKTVLRLSLVALFLISLSFIAGKSQAQSGRSWMNGMVFAQSDTQGLPDATIELIGDANSPRLQNIKLTAKTTSNGHYELKDIPYGEYTFRVTAEGYFPYQIDLYLASDSLTKVHVKLKKY
jgi:hypothetical protein